MAVDVVAGEGPEGFVRDPRRNQATAGGEDGAESEGFQRGGEVGAYVAVGPGEERDGGSGGA